VASTPGPSGPFGSDYARYAGLGFQLAATLALFTLGGWWLDERFGTSPWLLLLGVLLGFGGGLYALLKAVPGVGAKAKRSKHDR
jgi:F0F1-type ATP synthase assembly protein I